MLWTLINFASASSATYLQKEAGAIPYFFAADCGNKKSLCPPLSIIIQIYKCFAPALNC